MRPIITLEGGHEVNDVFLDNVKVPVENRIFHENQGWTCAKALLAHERSGIAGVARSKRGAREAARRSPRTERRRRRPSLLADAVLPPQGGRAGDRPDGAGVHRAAHPGRRKQRQGPGPGKLDPQDQGHRDPAAPARTGAGGGRPLRRAVPARPAGHNAAPIGPDYADGAAPATISTAARPRSTAAPTRSSATSSPRWCWASEAATSEAGTQTADAATFAAWIPAYAGNDQNRGRRPMDFSFTEEQSMLRDTVASYLARPLRLRQAPRGA